MVVRARNLVVLVLIAGCVLSCRLDEPPPLPQNTFAFAVFGDGPYRTWELGRYRRMIEDINRADVEWMIHVGDIFWHPCSDRKYEKRLATLNEINHPVIYTPGDNEWVDCFKRAAGRYQPLERLEFLRKTFFTHPYQSLGGVSMRVESQVDDPEFSEFVENVRWRRGGFLFATVHIVGSYNGEIEFPDRSREDDAAGERRTDAAIAWMNDAFAIATRDSLHGVVLAMHGNTGFDVPGRGFERFVERLREQVFMFARTVILIHGDSHVQRVDHPFHNPLTNEPLENVTRVEVFGSPDIGWVRVVVDSVTGGLVGVEPRLMPAWWLF